VSGWKRTNAKIGRDELRLLRNLSIRPTAINLSQSVAVSALATKWRNRAAQGFSPG
jgi:hypothetical protein